MTASDEFYEMEKVSMKKIVQADVCLEELQANGQTKLKEVIRKWFRGQ